MELGDEIYETYTRFVMRIDTWLPLFKSHHQAYIQSGCDCQTRKYILPDQVVLGEIQLLHRGMERFCRDAHHGADDAFTAYNGSANMAERVWDQHSSNDKWRETSSTNGAEYRRVLHEVWKVACSLGTSSGKRYFGRRPSKYTRYCASRRMRHAALSTRFAVVNNALLEDANRFLNAATLSCFAQTLLTRADIAIGSLKDCLQREARHGRALWMELRADEEARQSSQRTGRAICKDCGEHKWRRCEPQSHCSSETAISDRS